MAPVARKRIREALRLVSAGRPRLRRLQPGGAIFRWNDPYVLATPDSTNPALAEYQKFIDHV